MRILGLIFLGLSFLGCKEYSSPKGVSKTFVYGIKKNNFDLYLSTLDGTVKPYYGNEMIFAFFQKTLEPIQDLKELGIQVSDAYTDEIISATERIRTYQVNIYNNSYYESKSDHPPLHLFTLTTPCRFKHSINLHPKKRPCDPPSGGGTCDGSDTHFYKDVFCQITDIEIHVTAVLPIPERNEP